MNSFFFFFLLLLFVAFSPFSLSDGSEKTIIVSALQLSQIVVLIETTCGKEFVDLETYRLWMTIGQSWNMGMIIAQWIFNRFEILFLVKSENSKLYLPSGKHDIVRSIETQVIKRQSGSIVLHFKGWAYATAVQWFCFHYNGWMLVVWESVTMAILAI